MQGMQAMAHTAAAGCAVPSPPQPANLHALFVTSTAPCLARLPWAQQLAELCGFLEEQMGLSKGWLLQVGAEGWCCRWAENFWWAVTCDCWLSKGVLLLGQTLRHPCPALL